jgi:hypothetical protein
MGAVAQRCAAIAHCPVVMVKPPPAEPGDDSKPDRHDASAPVSNPAGS